MIKKFIEAVFPGKLERMCKSEKGGFLQGLLILAFGVLLSSLVYLVGEVLLLLPLNGMQGQLPYAIISILLSGLTRVTVTFFGLLAVFVLFHVILKLLGGKGSFGQLLYMASIPYVLLSLIEAIAELIGYSIGSYLRLPLVDWLAGFIVYLYGFYLLYIVGKTVHDMKGIRPVIGMVLTAGIVVGTLLILVLIFLWQIAVAVAGSQGTFGQ